MVGLEKFQIVLGQSGGLRAGGGGIDRDGVWVAWASGLGPRTAVTARLAGTGGPAEA